MKRISDTFVYKRLKTTTAIENNIKLTFLDNGISLGKEEYEETYNLIKKSYRFFGTNEALSMIDKGRAKVIFEPSKILSPIVPYALIGSGTTTPVVLMNLSKFISYNEKNKTYRFMDGRDRALFTYLVSSMLQYYYAVKPNSTNHFLRNNTKIYRTICKIYAEMCCILLRKNYRINVDPIVSSEVYSIMYKFCYVNVLEGDMKKPLSSLGLPSNIKLTKDRLDTIDAYLMDDDGKVFTDPNQLVIKLSEMYNMLKDITFSDFQRSFIGRYGNFSLFMLEHPLMLIHNLIGAYVGAYIGNDNSIISVADRDLGRLYTDIMTQLVNSGVF